MAGCGVWCHLSVLLFFYINRERITKKKDDMIKKIQRKECYKRIKEEKEEKREREERIIEILENEIIKKRTEN